MGWTKKEFVVQAFEEIGYASYIYDAAPEQLNSVLRRLDAMLATWNAKGIRIGYPLPSSPNNSDLNEQTNVPDSANEAIYLNLAVRIAPSFGKQLSPESKQLAKDALNALLVKAAFPPEMQVAGNIPIGTGNKRFNETGNQTLIPAEEALLAGNDSAIDFN